PPALPPAPRGAGPGELERIRLLRWVGLDGRRLEHLDRLLMVSSRGEKKPPGTVGERTEPRVRLCGVFVEQAQQPFCFGKVVDADERLDSNRARERGEDLVQ